MERDVVSIPIQDGERPLFLTACRHEGGWLIPVTSATFLGLAACGKLSRLVSTFATAKPAGPSSS